MGLNSAQ